MGTLSVHSTSQLSKKVACVAVSTGGRVAESCSSPSASLPAASTAACRSDSCSGEPLLAVTSSTAPADSSSRTAAWSGKHSAGKQSEPKSISQPAWWHTAPGCTPHPSKAPPDERRVRHAADLGPARQPPTCGPSSQAQQPHTGATARPAPGRRCRTAGCPLCMPPALRTVLARALTPPCRAGPPLQPRHTLQVSRCTAWPPRHSCCCVAAAAQGSAARRSCAGWPAVPARQAGGAEGRR